MHMIVHAPYLASTLDTVLYMNHTFNLCMNIDIVPLS